MFIGGIGCERVALLQLRTAGGVSFAMADAEVLTNKGSVAVGEVATKYLFRCVLKGLAWSSLPRDRTWGAGKKRTIQLMSVEMLGARIALAAAFVDAFEFAIGGGATAATASLRGLFV